MSKIKIIDVIHHRNKYAVQEMVVVDRQPRFLYERKDNWLIGEDGGLYNFYYYRPCRHSKAFANRQFEIPLRDGGSVTAKGQWWAGTPVEYRHLQSKGIASIKELEECHVFISRSIDPDVIAEWLKSNEATNNLHKYDKRHKNYGLQTIVSPWEQL